MKMKVSQKSITRGLRKAERAARMPQRKNKICSLVLVLATILTSISAGSFFVYAQGLDEQAVSIREYGNSDTRDLLISSEGDFIFYAEALSENSFDGRVIHITKDLDFGTSEYENYVWSDHINHQKELHAIIDGHGHSISGINYTAPTTSYKYVGLLGGKLVASDTEYLDYGGAYAGVFNLRIVNSSVSIAKYCGALFGSIEAADKKVVIKNVYVDAKITSNSTYIGGFVGLNENQNTLISDSVFAGALHCEGDKSGLGGFVGINGASKSTSASLTVNNCAVYGSITSAGGGFVGINGNSATGSTNASVVKISNSICAASFSGSSEDRGMAVGANHTNDGVTVENMYASDKNTSVTGCVGSSGNDGMIVVEDNKLWGESAMEIAGFTATNEYPIPNEVAVFNGAHTKVVGYQKSDYKNGYCDVRLLALLDDGKSGKELEGFSSVGFDIVMRAEKLGGKQWTNRVNGEAPYIETVYSSVEAAGKTATAAELGGDYIFMATVGGIKNNSGILKFTVKPFYENENGERIFGSTYEFTFDTNN